LGRALVLPRQACAGLGLASMASRAHRHSSLTVSERCLSDGGSFVIPREETRRLPPPHFPPTRQSMPSRALDSLLTEPALRTGLSPAQRADLVQRVAADRTLAREVTIATFARAFFRARVMARDEARPPPLELPELDRRMQGVFALVLPSNG